MGQKSLLITGCSSGIGLDAARGMAKRGWRVFATCRQQKDVDRLVAEGLESLPLDLADTDSIAAALDTVLERTGGTLDALFNNGAFGTPGAVEDLPRGALREIFEVNLFGQFDLIKRVMPVMRAQGHGRIVNNSSVLGFTPLRMRGAYVATKYAMEGLTDVLRLESEPAPVDIILIEPGPITSRIRENSRAHFETWIDWENSALRRLYEAQLIPRLYRDTTKPDRFELPASAVTEKLIHALESKRPRPRYYVTTPTYMMGALKRVTSTRIFDRIVLRG
ncbi:SDR family NAD(P)-dependent oxidoreductase [Oceanomicrobium pacificus]|uniref:SDR family NAD(P)-dependent oxidoreductase n=1 Tax=Oceanomicrobium pacificus TaxID=2692916 RepID=A0A6B0U2K2_9RHOB|nr:SDR family NAD(P)-dependent oxidoreductase [Oceanomicrobium pacificus]MXU65231.1 SDR family NAD(P)-dependent oxidoreductase [Oceanomicrobium pacificus]